MNLFIKSLMIATMIAGFMVFFTTGCTKSLPEIEAGLKMPAPHFDNVQTSLTSFYIPDADGFCHKLIKRIEIKLENKDWVDLLTIDPTATVSCATDGKFHFIADFNTGYLASAKSILQAGGSVTIVVRGYSDILISEIGQIVLSYGAVPASYNVALAVTQNNRSNGGTGNFVVSGQAKPNYPTANSASYLIYGAVRSK